MLNTQKAIISNPIESNLPTVPRPQGEGQRKKFIYCHSNFILFTHKLAFQKIKKS